MMEKVLNLILWIGLSICFGVIIWLCDEKKFGLGGAIAGALITMTIERSISAFIDLGDTTDSVFYAATKYEIFCSLPKIV